MFFYTNIVWYKLNKDMLFNKEVIKPFYLSQHKNNKDNNLSAQHTLIYATSLISSNSFN